MPLRAVTPPTQTSLAARLQVAGPHGLAERSPQFVLGLIDASTHHAVCLEE